MAKRIVVDDGLEVLRLQLALHAAESTQRMMTLAAHYGAATLLLKHFGSLDKVSLEEQLQFLFRESPVDQERRNKYAYEWLLLKAPQSKEAPTEVGMIAFEILQAMLDDL